MAENLVANYRAFASIHSSIGELSAFTPTLGDLERLFSGDGKVAAVQAPPIFLRRLMRLVCYPSTLLREEKFRPDVPVLSEEDTAKLTDDDVALFATAYLSAHGQLFREVTSDVETDSGGNRTARRQLGKVVTPKMGDESEVEYLSRLLVKDDERWHAQTAALVERFSKGAFSSTVSKALEQAKKDSNRIEDLTRPALSSSLAEAAREAQRHSSSLEDLTKSAFSPSLSEAAREARSLADKFRSQFVDVPAYRMSKLEPFVRPPIEVPKPAQPRIDAVADDFLSAQERSVHHLENLEGAMTRLLEQSTKSTELGIQYGEVQARMAAEIKAASDGNKEIAKRNTQLTHIVIAIAALGVLISATQVGLGLSQGRDASDASRAQTDRVIAGLQEIDASIKADRDVRQRVDLLENRLEQRDEEMRQLLENHRDNRSNLQSRESPAVTSPPLKKRQSNPKPVD